MKKYLLLFTLFICFTSFSQNKPNKTKDPLEITMEHLKKELLLDSFQEAAIKIYLAENFSENEKIFNSEIPNDEKKTKSETAKKSFDEKVIKLLNPNQIKLFDDLKNKRKSKKDSKKKKEED